MLQQTQSSVVIPYFNKWMNLFPTIEILAASPLETVLKTWEGLGYYSRAKNLHEGAKQIVKKGYFPQDEELLSIKGIGPYTYKAILSFAFLKKAAPVDGNVTRVISRLFAIRESVEKTSTKKAIGLAAESLLPDENPEIVAEALIELGATACQKKARCPLCPVKSSCRAYGLNLQSLLPTVKAAPKTIHLERMVAVIECNNHFLIKNNQAGKVMEYLFEFPYLETKTVPELINHFQILNLTLEKTLSEQSHGFTKYQAHLTPYYFKAEKMIPIEGYSWHAFEILKKSPFSSGHRKIFEELCD